MYLGSKWTELVTSCCTAVVPVGVLLKTLGGGLWPASQTLTIFMIKICEFHYPIYNLMKNLIPYL